MYICILYISNLVVLVENQDLRLPLKNEKSNSVGEIECTLGNITIDINAYRPRGEILS